jgi:hypothetical protein
MNYKMQINTLTLRYLKHIYQQQKVRRMHDHAHVRQKRCGCKMSKEISQNLPGIYMEFTIMENGQGSTTSTSKVRRNSKLLQLRVVDECHEDWVDLPRDAAYVQKQGSAT